MEATEAKTAECCTVQPAGRRYWLIGGALITVALALYFGWGWLAASGAGAILLGLAPCLIMCALGLCMGGKSKREPSLAEIRKTYED